MFKNGKNVHYINNTFNKCSNKQKIVILGKGGRTMKKKEKSNVPKKEDYIVKYKFKNNSDVDVNETIKKCFISQLRMNVEQKNHFTIL